MKNGVIVLAVWAISLHMLAARAEAQGQSAFPQQDFSATMVVTSPAGKQMSQKVYRLGDKMRTDMPGGRMHSVLLLGEHKYYMVMPQVCMEMPQRSPDPHELTGKVERKDLGSATVDGHPAKIEEITITPASGGKSVTMKAWEATDLKGFPLRVEMPTKQGTMRMDYKDVDISPPPASLFAVPQDCRVMPSAPGTPPGAN